MRRVPLVLAILLPMLARADLRPTLRPGDDAAVVAWLDRGMPALLARYQAVHRRPELSDEERETAAAVASALGAAGYAVTAGVGGTGVVAVLANGAGPTVLIRGDMDALPVGEATGLPYASERPGVMHACGHDVHVAALVGVGEALAALRARWQGTLVLVAQPAEEMGEGAHAMIVDGLLTRFPTPDVALALHVAADQPAGTLGWVPGWWAANVDTVTVVVHGRGGHGARPQDAIDPVVVSAQLVLALQTLVSRTLDPLEDAVVTVGSIHGGTKSNVIPDDVTMDLTVRSFGPDVRRQLLDGIRRLADGTCAAFGCPRPPTVTLHDGHTPAAWNDPALTQGAAAVFRGVFGADAVRERRAEMIGEDFGVIPATAKVPGVLFRVGAAPPGGTGGLHSATFAPDATPTLRTAVRAMADLALAVLAPPR